MELSMRGFSPPFSLKTIVFSSPASLVSILSVEILLPLPNSTSD